MWYLNHKLSTIHYTSPTHLKLVSASWILLLKLSTKVWHFSVTICTQSQARNSQEARIIPGCKLLLTILWVQNIKSHTICTFPLHSPPPPLVFLQTSLVPNYTRSFIYLFIFGCSDSTVCWVHGPSHSGGLGGVEASRSMRTFIFHFTFFFPYEESFIASILRMTKWHSSRETR